MKLESLIEEIPELELKGTFSRCVQGATAMVQSTPDILFVDLEMPYMDGYGLLDWLIPHFKVMDKKPKIVVISGNEEIMDRDNTDVHAHIDKRNLNEPQDLRAALSAFV